MSYAIDTPSFLDGVILAKIICGVEINDKIVWSDEAIRLNVIDKPGSVEANFEIGGVKITTYFTVLMEGRATPDWEGAAVYKIETEPATPVALKIGGGNVFNVSFNTSNGGWIMDDTIAYEGTKCKVEKKQGIISSTKHTALVGIKTTSNLTKQTSDNGEYLTLKFEDGAGKLHMANARSQERVEELLGKDAKSEVGAVEKYYDNLLSSCKIETPEKVMDDGFASAAVLMDYSWYWPYGWMESPHHWMATFHIQHTPAAELLGQTDRVVDNLLTHSKHQLLSGDIPNFFPDGTPMTGIFGGSNQYYAWQVAQHIKYTNDIEILKTLAPTLDNSLAHVEGKYNADSDDLFAWGLQVGNQEDMVATPYNGTSATIEAINMIVCGPHLKKNFG